jgi:hypothetical protein
MMLMVVGSEVWPGPRLRQAMLERERDDSWRGVISTTPSQWEEFLERTLHTERSFIESRRAVASEGFKYFLVDEERSRMARLVRVFVPPERFPPFLAKLLFQQSRVTSEQMLELAGGLFHFFSSDEAEQGSWRMLMELAEACEFNTRLAETDELRVRWVVLKWLSYVGGLQKLLMEWREVNARQNPQEMLSWLERVPEVRRSLPPLPEQVDFRVQPLITLLRTQLISFGLLEGMSALLHSRTSLDSLSKELRTLQSEVNRLEAQPGSGLELQEKMKSVTRIANTIDSLVEELRTLQLERFRQNHPGAR